MPRFSIPFSHIAPDGSVVTGIACGRSRFQACSVTGCNRHATFRCDFPVLRSKGWKRGRSATCDRWLCEKHRTSTGKDRDYCPPHVRAAEALRQRTVDSQPPPAPRALPAPAEPAQASLPLPDLAPKGKPCGHTRNNPSCLYCQPRDGG